MTGKELKQKYIDFFVQQGHKVIPDASLVPQNDPTALFISAGMHPLVPYLLGEPHHSGKRLVSVQKCLRTDDIDEVGDSIHHTFFQMLGNWSLGDYWKEEAIKWSYDFLTSPRWLGIEKKKLAVSVFAGDDDAPFDEESYSFWVKLGIFPDRILKLPKKNNWWGPVGQTGPCGPDTEMFVWIGQEDSPDKFELQNPGWVEIWNSVFMQYDKILDNGYKPLVQRNVDTGMGLERTLAILNGLDDDYKTDLFWPILEKIEEISNKTYKAENLKSMRVIADHLKAATFLISDGVVPGNVERSYILRRLIRRAIRFGRLVGISRSFTSEVAKTVIDVMKDDYPELVDHSPEIASVLQMEEEKFSRTLERGLREVGKHKILGGKTAFYLYETYGFPLEMTEEIAIERGQKVDKELFAQEFIKHQTVSRQGASGKFAGGLADHSEQVTKYHTATHLLQAVLRQVLGNQIQQKGSNLTAERLRFDFSHPTKLTEEQIRDIENLVNQKIVENLLVSMEIMSLDEAKRGEALAFFTQKYEGKVKVYSIGNFSKEVCGGPHVDFTGTLGKFKIIKEETAGAGIRRIYAICEK